MNQIGLVEKIGKSEISSEFFTKITFHGFVSHIRFFSISFFKIQTRDKERKRNVSVEGIVI